jgi:hypothetical protein
MTGGAKYTRGREYKRHRAIQNGKQLSNRIHVADIWTETTKQDSTPTREWRIESLSWYRAQRRKERRVTMRPPKLERGEKRQRERTSQCDTGGKLPHGCESRKGPNGIDI